MTKIDRMKKKMEKLEAEFQNLDNSKDMEANLLQRFALNDKIYNQFCKDCDRNYSTHKVKELISEGVFFWCMVSLIVVMSLILVL